MLTGAVHRERLLAGSHLPLPQLPPSMHCALCPLLHPGQTLLPLLPLPQARTGALVNLRDAFSPKDSEIAGEVMGAVETKVLDQKVAAVEEQVTKIAKTELHGALPPQLARISKTTALARTSMTGGNLGRTSATQIAQQVAEIEEALAQPLGANISAEQRQELERRAQAMREAAARLQRVSGECWSSRRKLTRRSI